MTDVDCEPPESIPADTEEKWPPAFTPSMADAATSMAGAPSMLLLQSQVLREQYTQLRENEERDRLQQQAELERIMCQEEPIVANQNLAGDTQLQLLEEVKKLKQEITAELAAVSRKKRREDKEKKKEKKEKKEKKKEKKEKEVANADEEMSPSKAKKKKKKKEPWELDSDEEHQNGLSVILPEGRKGKPFNLAEELAQIVGLDSVKTAIRSISTTIRAHQRRVERGLTKATNNKMMCHMLFLGNPGTGKTTMARVVARLLKDIGLLAKGHLVEASAKDLIAGHCGQTALKTAAVCKKALGGVLFIDEAYGINPKGDSNFGQECVDTLVTKWKITFTNWWSLWLVTLSQWNGFWNATKGYVRGSTVNSYLHLKITLYHN
eukprot:TRINITY_DN67692_c3_g4_i2.p1 TRINITY_DN67692_c3_g4~~TRINITY_DN67692_c3_g4_i2.p1  ORF type:complete len:379 (-),score=51.00 TRINITY_DN67692_c3_g4_i2:1433-2569(-)